MCVSVRLALTRQAQSCPRLSLSVGILLLLLSTIVGP
jgi:hypothetical protein